MGQSRVGNNYEVELLITERIVTFEDRQPVKPVELITRTMRVQLGVVPPQLVPENVNGTAYAVIDDSRWIVHCLNPVCQGSLLASKQQPYYICVDCASPENGFLWYKVEFPANAAAIEEVLLERPYRARVLTGTVGRGWDKGQSLAALRKENATLVSH